MYNTFGTGVLNQLLDYHEMQAWTHAFSDYQEELSSNVNWVSSTDAIIKKLPRLEYGMQAGRWEQQAALDPQDILHTGVLHSEVQQLKRSI